MMSMVLPHRLIGRWIGTWMLLPETTPGSWVAPPAAPALAKAAPAVPTTPVPTAAVKTIALAIRDMDEVLSNLTDRFSNNACRRTPLPQARFSGAPRGFGAPARPGNRGGTPAP